MIPKIEPSPCSHLYYLSCELLVKHLFWHLRQKADDLEPHNQALETLLVRHRLCGCYRNTIILCDLLEKILQYAGLDETATVRQLVDYLHVVYVIVKYCKKHHLLYFLTNCLDGIIQVIHCH